MIAGPGHQDRRPPGRPASVDAEMIVHSATALIDERGMDGFSMRALAAGMGVSPMSIYRHVDGRDDLLARIPDSLLAGVSADVARRRRALPALRAVADGLGDVLQEHPNLAELFHQPDPGPNMLAAAEHCVALLVEEGCPQQDAFEVLRALVALVVGQSVTSHGERSSLGVRTYLAGVQALLAPVR